MASNVINDIPRISVADLLQTAPAELEALVLAGGEYLTSQVISSDRIQKLGLALTGFTDYLRKGRLKIVGNSEISYLTQLSDEGQAAALAKIDPEVVSCILITKGLSAPFSLRLF